jgi:hypothetical protein
MLIQLAYVSKAAIPPYDPGLLEIARTSLRNNARLGVTGALFFDDDLFYQVLEGDDSVVAVLFDRIRQDPRHIDVTPLWHAPIAERSFKDWSMKFIDGRTQKKLGADFSFNHLTQHGAGPQESWIDALKAA